MNAEKTSTHRKKCDISLLYVHALIFVRQESSQPSMISRESTSLIHSRHLVPAYFRLRLCSTIYTMRTPQYKYWTDRPDRSPMIINLRTAARTDGKQSS
eukprot:764346-Hanusia_phi.AAC.5